MEHGTREHLQYINNIYSYSISVWMVDIDINLRGIVVKVHAMYTPIVNVNTYLLTMLIPNTYIRHSEERSDVGISSLGVHYVR
jgi:hypothetical protein